MKTTRPTIPEFENEEAEALFWQEHDSTEYLDWSQARTVSFSQLKPSLKSISLRLPEPMLDRIRIMANERDVPYQSLIKMILAEHLLQNQRQSR